MGTTSTEYLSLPTVRALRGTRKPKRIPVKYPYNFLEFIRYYSGTDPDLIWGPFYKRVRAARRERSNWAPYDARKIWDNIPDAAQTRPGVIGRFFNWVLDQDPPPTLTIPKSVKALKDTEDTDATSKPIIGTDGWKKAIRINDDSSPARIDFTKWYGRFRHPEDYDDDFFRTNYQTLYDRVVEFAQTWFGASVWLDEYRDKAEDYSPWEVPMTEQFINYARVVAHEDGGYVEWRDILNDPHHRKWLCVGIFAQIIERKIFNSLLFGAGKEFQDELERHDSHWVLQEGFSRKQGRRQIARSALGEGLVPQFFWDSVDDLAGQTVLIFQPLLTLVSLAGKVDLPTFWQEVHSLLAMAGYLHVCMAISPSIFHILSASPGARFQWDEEAHADQRIYDVSKAFHKSHEERWRTIADVSSKSQGTDVSKLLESLEDSEDLSDYLPFPVTEEEYRVMDHQRRRGGKVMYAVFPKLTRYTAENIGETFAGVKPRKMQEVFEGGEGMRITLISRCMVVYYQGLVHSPYDRDDGVPLDVYLQNLSWDRMPGLIPYWRYYWTDSGTPTAWFHWPLWPESLDKYWLWWFITMIISQIIQLKLGPASETDNGFWTTIVYKPFQWFLWEGAMYIFIRLFGITAFQGPFSFLRLQALGWVLYFTTVFLHKYDTGQPRLFSLLCAPIMWLDQVLLGKMPKFVMGLAGVLDERYNAATGLFGAWK